MSSLENTLCGGKKGLCSGITSPNLYEMKFKIKSAYDLLAFVYI